MSWFRNKNVSASVFFLCVTLLIPQLSFAQEENYSPLEEIPFLVNDQGKIDVTSADSLVNYANTVIQVMIGIAILLAVVMVIVAGVTYMTTGSFTKKGNAKDRISKALIGLLLALSSVVILSSINPSLVEINELEDIEVGETEIDPSISEIEVNPDNTDTYYCYNSDLTTGGLPWGNWDKVCAQTLEVCQQERSVDESKDPNDSCSFYVYHKGGFDNADNTGECYVISPSDPTKLPDVNCHPNEQECENQQETQENSGSDIAVECQPPEAFAFGSVEDGGNGETYVYTASGEVVKNNTTLSEVSSTSESTSGRATAKEQAKSKCNLEGENYIETSGECSGGCTVQGCNSAEDIENALAYTCPRGDDGKYDTCFPSERLNCENCGSLTDSLSFTPGEHYRPDPRVCHDDYAIYDNQCKINNDLAGKIDTLESNLDIPWTLNEAWPPTIRHQNECHAKGTCVDIALRQDTKPDGTPVNPYTNDPTNHNVEEHAQRINTFISAAEEDASLTVKYEVGSDALYTALTNNDEGTSVPENKIIEIGVDPHFSVYR